MSARSLYTKGVFKTHFFAATILSGAAVTGTSIPRLELNGASELAFMIFADAPPVGLTGAVVTLQGHLNDAGAGVFTDILARDGNPIATRNPEIFILAGKLGRNEAIHVTVPTQHIETEIYDEFRLQIVPAGATMANVTCISCACNPAHTPNLSEDDALLSNFHIKAPI